MPDQTPAPLTDARLHEIVRDFIDERPKYVTACRNAHPDNAHDYHRWQGGAEARRQLAERLGWTVPYEVDEKTAPKTERAAQQPPAGYLVGWEEGDGRVNIALDEADLPLEGADTLAYTNIGEAWAFLAEIAPEDPSTQFRVYELREVQS